MYKTTFGQEKREIEIFKRLHNVLAKRGSVHRKKELCNELKPATLT